MRNARLDEAQAGIKIVRRNINNLMHADREGNGNPLQCSCLENPRDGGAWQAALYGVAQSWTQLKRFSSSSLDIIWRRAWQPTPVFLPGESHGLRSLVGHSS